MSLWRKLPIGLTFIPMVRKAFCTPTADDEDKVAIYLTENSKLILEEGLKKVGLSGYRADYIVLRRGAGKADRYPYEPLYGRKVCFRLKGLLVGENGRIAVSHETNNVNHFLTFISQIGNGSRLFFLCWGNSGSRL